MLAGKFPPPDFDEIVQAVRPDRRAEALSKLGALFAQGAEHFNPQHVALFDGILNGLLAQAGADVRAELANRFAALVNAPPLVVRDLVEDDDIRVSGPLLRTSPLIDEPMLIAIARIKDQQHLLAIAERAAISANVTDVILRRGEREVVRSAARNITASFSVQGHANLVQRAADDGMLAVALGQREDLPPRLLQQLLSESAELVRRKMFQAANPARKTALARTMVRMSMDGAAQRVQRDYARAQKAIIHLHKTGQLTQEALVQFAKEAKFEEAVAALAAMSGLTIDMVDQLVCGGKRDSILILGRALGFDWVTVRALLMLQLAPERTPSATDVEDARASFERLALSTAQRMLKFWKDRAQR